MFLGPDDETENCYPSNHHRSAKMRNLSFFFSFSFFAWLIAVSLFARA